ncbi:MAG: T9SS type A sorting domain-containing protein [Muribaculaceae bacterium]|nr:T9SS type A sorting domain-containing protein [Muribaculaceae bacterium]
MKQTLLILMAAAAIAPVARGADTELSLVVERQGFLVFKQPVSLYSKIKLNPNDSEYTLVSNNPSEGQDLTLRYGLNPIVSLKEISTNDFQTSVETVGAAESESLSYNGSTEALVCASAEALEVVVCNVSGRVVLTGHVGGDFGELPVSSLADGIYIATARGASSVQTFKFVKR